MINAQLPIPWIHEGNIATLDLPGDIVVTVWDPHESGTWYVDMHDADGHSLVDCPDSTARYGVEVARKSSVMEAIDAATRFVWGELLDTLADAVARQREAHRAAFPA